jgi:DNA ligase (NAD+)
MSPSLKFLNLIKFLIILALLSMSSLSFRVRLVVALRPICSLDSRSRLSPTQFRLFSTIDKEDKHIYEDFKWLSNEILRNDELYYNLQPQLEDEEYDALVRKEIEIANNYPDLLQKLQDESGLGIKATRSGRVGSIIKTQRLKRKHLQPMLSLDNVHDDAQLWAWLKRVRRATEETHANDDRVRILTEPKLDGVSLSLRYELTVENDKTATYNLAWASTRGDGNRGQDVSKAASSIRNIPKSLPASVYAGTSADTGYPISIVEVRGEVIMPNKEFSELSSYSTFSNARNAASGILLRKPSDNPQEQKESNSLQALLHFYAYDLVEDKPETSEFMDGLDNRKLLQKWGFTLPEPIAITELNSNNNATDDEFWTEKDIGSMLTYYKALLNHRQDQAASSDDMYIWGDVDMDGCVHKVVNPDLKKGLGRSMKSPNWAVAHKFPALACVTELVDVTIQVGRTGALTPVANLKPVVVGGVTISRATLHNFHHMHEIFGSDSSVPVNTSVLVRRAGDVIPQVVSLVQGNSNDEVDQSLDKNSNSMISLKIPTHCPACGSDVVWETLNLPANSKTLGQVARCGGPSLLCPPRATTSLSHAYSRDALDVTGLSEARIQQLMDAKLLQFPSDVFKLSEQDWKNMEDSAGWGGKSVLNLRKSIQDVATRGISLGRFIYALGIRQVGKHSSELVASSYGTKEAFLLALEAAKDWQEPEEEKAETDPSPHPFSQMQGRLGIGPVLINSLVSFSKTEELVKSAKDLGEAILVLEESTEQESLTDNARSSDDQTKPWKGFRVVFTGSIANVTRNAAQKAAKELGAKATPGSVSKSTDLVVHGEKGGKKLQQAVDFGIQTMPGGEFVELLKSNELI